MSAFLVVNSVIENVCIFQIFKSETKKEHVGSIEKDRTASARLFVITGARSAYNAAVCRSSWQRSSTDDLPLLPSPPFAFFFWRAARSGNLRSPQNSATPTRPPPAHSLPSGALIASASNLMNDQSGSGLEFSSRNFQKLYS